MTFVKERARLMFALLVTMLFVLAMAACEDPNGAGDDPGGADPGFEDPGADPGAGF